MRPCEDFMKQNGGMYVEMRSQVKSDFGKAFICSFCYLGTTFS